MNEEDLVYKFVYIGQKPTPEQAEEIRKLKDRPIVYDEEFPELTDEELDEFRRVNPKRRKPSVS